MELSARAIEEAVHPTAAVSPSRDIQERPSVFSVSSSSSLPPPPPPWDDSLLNPKNRIDSLELPHNPLWRLDGCAGLGTQYYTVPLFLKARPPVRMDVFVPETQPAILRQQLELSVAFHTKDSCRLSRLGISKYIVRALHFWVTTEFADLDSFEQVYRSVPFGSRIVIENLAFDIRNLRISIGMNHNLERQLLSLPALTNLWGAQFPFPPVVEFYDVHVIKILHDSVCLVCIEGQLYILKALTSGAKYLYHELKTLCSMQPHSNIIAHPVHIVRKACGFGGKRAIVGFTTIFHSQGNLRDLVPQLRIHDQLSLSLQMRWSIQLTQALEHVRWSSKTYYPDLRLDNIVLSDNGDIVMVDFEQRGVWCEFAAPEVNAIEYVRLVAMYEDAEPEDRQKYEFILERLLPNFRSLEEDRYTDQSRGYNIPWAALSPGEQEAAEVYMLGRVLWCLFEGVSAPQRAAVWQSYPWESELEFPSYLRTPPKMRDLIERCTRGRRRTLGTVVVREGSRLVLKDVGLGQEDEEAVRKAARRFWEGELQAAEEFLAMREEQKSQGMWKDNHFERPTLKQVLTELKQYQEESF